jgi:epoxyqueuosine reductase
MRRNACVVLGNRGGASAVPALRAALLDPDPMIRSHAEWAIQRIREE